MSSPRQSLSAKGTRFLAMLVSLAALAAACGSDASDDGLRGIQREPLPEVSGVTIPDASADGADFEFVANDDEVLLIYFGYTSCPDVCPTTLADVRSALDTMDADEASRVELAMVTIDPERDTAEVLTGYVQSFVPGSHALTTTDETLLQSAADLFGASYSVVEAEDGGEAEVGHTGFLYAVNDAGQLTVSWAFGTPPADIEHDLGVLLASA